MARLEFVEANGSGVGGHLLFTQEDDSSSVNVMGPMYSLTAGPHGFHVHANGALGNECSDAGGHFNPFNVNNDFNSCSDAAFPTFSECSWST